jgi:hypothetical protein
MSQGLGVFAQKVLIATGIPLMVIALLFMFAQALAVLLLAFAAILLAIFLNEASATVSRYTSLSSGWSLTLVMLLLLALTIGGGWMLAPKVAEQIDQLTQQLPQAIDWLRERLGRYEWARDWLLQNYEPQQLVPGIQRGRPHHGRFLRGGNGRRRHHPAVVSRPIPSRRARLVSARRRAAVPLSAPRAHPRGARPRGPSVFGCGCSAASGHRSSSVC